MGSLRTRENICNMLMSILVFALGVAMLGWLLASYHIPQFAAIRDRYALYGTKGLIVDILVMLCTAYVGRMIQMMCPTPMVWVWKFLMYASWAFVAYSWFQMFRGGGYGGGWS